MTNQPAYYIGLMSGTSIDAIDAALVTIDNNSIQLIETHNEPIPLAVKETIRSLSQPGFNAINRLGKLDTQLGRLFADATLNLLKKSNRQTKDIIAIGSHGQTIRHNPNDEHPFTVQIGDPNTITAHTRITTVADFRRRDLAHSGQGAPLTPAFHQFLLQHLNDPQWVLNIGGIANVTLLNHQKIITGFDTGPGNMLLDGWCEQHQQQPFDRNGQWAAGGTVDHTLLDLLLADPFFKQSPPKSTGREYFNINWLNNILKFVKPAPTPQDVQATLVELTAQSIADVITSTNNTPTTIHVCGGGAHNQELTRRLGALCPHHHIQTTDHLNIAPDWIEACAFAWLAKQTLEKQPLDLQPITGASPSSILGAIYQA